MVCVQSLFTFTDYFGYVTWEKSEMTRVGILSNLYHFYFCNFARIYFPSTDLQFLMGLEAFLMERN